MIRAAALAAGMLAAASPAFAHGTGWRLTGEQAVAVELYYADGDEMPFADVKVYAPEDARVPFLHGRADGRGRVAFVPDHDGDWTVVATDGDGHGINAVVPVKLGVATEVSSRTPLEMRALLIGSIMLNVILLLFAWKALVPSNRRAIRSADRRA